LRHDRVSAHPRAALAGAVASPFESIEALQAALDAWRQEYNTDRPH
jgi:transposase InsO family protein